MAGWFAWRRCKPHRSGRRFTANPPEDWVSGAAISPDGKNVVYRDQTGLYIRSIDSGETHALSLPEGFQKRIWALEWFRDGRKVLVGVPKEGGGELLDDQPPRRRGAALA